MTNHLRQRPGDQPLPTAAAGPGMHDLVIADLRCKDGTIWPSIIELFEERRDLGLERYGQPLQSDNGRDALRDLIEECADGVVYARQVQLEGDTEQTTTLAAHIERSLLEAVLLTQLLRTAAWPLPAAVTP